MRLCALLAALAAGCRARGSQPAPACTASPARAAASATANPVSPPGDAELAACRGRIAAAMAEPAAPGAPGFAQARVAILGRARAEPMLFVRAPAATRDEELGVCRRKN
ncbi:MAG: hypothetical protein HY744_24720 [Deltaproteobacteria bacterium]|nr:hypothetical protein [Deltaproteobacteria bacterium]